MKGFNRSTHAIAGILLGLCVFAIQQQSGHAAYTMNETCAQYQNGYIANPSDCQGYGLCKDGQLLGTGVCGTGLLYDPNDGQCNYAAKVTCRTSAANICANALDNVMIANPNDCNQYCYCSNNSSQCESCPTYQVFDATSNACIWASAAKAPCPADSICRLVPNNKFVGDPDKCGQYITCLAGTGESKSCVTGTYSPVTNTCGNDNTCNTVPQDGDADPTMCVGISADYVADPTNCYGYYVCGASGSGTWGKCPLGTHFNDVTLKCVTPYSFACTHNRCGNLNVGWVAVVGTSCKEYNVCNNEVAGTTNYDCPTGYPYFDEYRQGCVATVPSNEKICAA